SSTRSPDCAPPGLGHAGEQPTTITFTRISKRNFSGSVSVYNSAVARASADVLKKVPLFAGLDNRELEQIAATMRERRFSTGDTVTAEVSGVVGFFIVESGQPEVEVEGQSRGTIG